VSLQLRAPMGIYQAAAIGDQSAGLHVLAAVIHRRKGVARYRRGALAARKKEYIPADKHSINCHP
jgi:hypothetical protein